MTSLDAPADDLRFAPLMLFLVQLLEVQQGVLVAGIEPDDLRKRLEGAVDEAAPLEVQAETEQYVGMFQCGQSGALE